MAALRKALIASLAVYAFPVVGRHNFSFWGNRLWAEVTAGGEGREALWIGADVGLALGLQLAAVLLFFWIFRGHDVRRWFAVVAAVPVFGWSLNWAYMLALPAYFLIAPETAPERADWEIACTVENAYLTPERSGVQLELALAREAWLERLPERRFAILAMPGCRLRDLDLTNPGAGGGIDYVAPGGAILYRTWDKQSGKQSHWFLGREGGAPLPLDPPDEKYWLPVLSSDGAAVAWLKSESASDGRGLVHVAWIRDLASGEERSIRLGAAVSGNPRLVAFDAAKGELVLSIDSERMLGLGLAGQVLWGPVRDTGIASLGDNFRRHARGWLAWNGPGHEGPVRIAWSLPSGEGRHEVPKGRAITDVALDPWSRFIAISVSPALSIGSVRDAVYVIRVKDGAEVYRRYLRPYARTRVAFLGPHFLALTRYAEADGTVTARVEVLRVPGPAPIAGARQWVEGFRRVVLPLLPLLAKFDAEGIGEEDCGPLHQASSAAGGLSAAPDRTTGETYRTLRAKLDEAVFRCDRWDPGPFSTALMEIEFLITDVEVSLIDEHGLEAVPEAALSDRGSYSVRPVTGDDGRVRAKRFGAPKG